MTRKQTRTQPEPAPILTAADGTVIGRIDDLQKQFSNMQNAIDLSQKSAAFIQAAVPGYLATRKPVDNPDTAFDRFGENFSPGRPNLPQNPDDQPRQFQYNVGTNLLWTPRAGYGILGYGTLRDLAFACKEIRLNFQKAKDTIRGLGHKVSQNDKSVTVGGQTYAATPPNFQEVINFWKYPDGYHCFDDWVDMILEDALVLGASAVYKNPDPDVEKAAQVIDASTWRILTDYNGRIPAHPLPAFIQTTYGRPNFWCSRKHLQLSPLHPTVNNPYGYSATEFIVQAVVQSIKRDSSRTANFTEGNVPAAFVGLPTAWSVTQIKDFTEWFNSILQGDVSRTSKIMFIPHDGQGIPVSPFSAIDQNATGLDEWLMKVSAWAVGNNPSEFGIMSGKGLGGKGAQEEGASAQYRGSTAVYTQYISRLVEDISRDYLDAPWLKSSWDGLEPTKDELETAQIETARINSGVWSVKFVQDTLGYDRNKYGETPPPAAAAVPGAAPAAGAQPPQLAAAQAAKAAEPMPGAATHTATHPPVQVPANFMKISQRAAEADLLAWRDKARFALQKGFTQPEFKSECIPAGAMKLIKEELSGAKTRQDLDNVFSMALNAARLIVTEPQPDLSKSDWSEIDAALADLEKLAGK